MAIEFRQFNFKDGNPYAGGVCILDDWFDNNASALSVSPALAEQYLDAAETLATAAVTTNMAKLVPCDSTTVGVDACGQQFIAAFGQRAYRRPLTAADTTLLTNIFNVGKATDFATGVRLVIETVLQSPQFLYRIEIGRAPAAADPSIAVTDGSAPNPTRVVPLDDWEMASRLSYLIWGSMPDDALFAAAAAGKLSSAADVAAQTQRMLKDPKAHDMVADFHNQWLGLGLEAREGRDTHIRRSPSCSRAARAALCRRAVTCSSGGSPRTTPCSSRSST